MLIETPPETVQNVTVKTVEIAMQNNKGRPIDVTICNVMPASILDSRTGEETEKIAVYFGEIDERLLLNVTNTKTIITKLGNDTDKWEGKKLSLYLGTYQDSQTGRPAKGVRIA